MDTKFFISVPSDLDLWFF